MAFVAKHTAVPVPKVFCAFQQKGVTYIVMERIKGDIIRNHWFSMTEKTKADLLSQLHELISGLRDIPPPQPGRVGAVDYTQLFDSRIQSNGFGPFPDSRGFHNFLRFGVTKSGKDDPELEQLITAHEAKQYPTCFTHGDLSTFNILVGREGKIVGIIDWEMAGWYPVYWEYTSTWHVSPYDEAWRLEVGKFLDSYPKELEMEQLRRKFFPVF